MRLSKPEAPMGHEYDQFMKAAAAKRRQVLRLHQKKVPQTEIAERVGVSRQRVNQIIKTAKVKEQSQ